MPQTSPALPFGSAPAETPPKPNIPPPLPRIDCPAFRLEIAGLARPAGRNVTDQEDARYFAIRLLSIFAHLFGDSLDRLTLWDRIGSAVATGVAKARKGDLEQFVSLCAEHIKADDGKVAACDALKELFQIFSARDREFAESVFLLFREKRPVLLVHARDRWAQCLAKEIKL